MPIHISLRTITSLVAFWLLCGLFAGCEMPLTDSQSKDPLDDAAKSSLPSETQNRVFRDRLGRSVSIPNIPKRIVSLSPATTELLFALDLGGSLVGATQSCDYPPEALSIPRIGTGPLEGISREAIVAQNPDLILCKADTHGSLTETFEALKIPILGLGAENLQELYDETILLGSIMNRATEADAFVRSMQERLQAIVARIPKSEQRPSPKVFYEVWDEPLMTINGETFIGELLEIAGAQNIFADTPIRYTRISLEEVIARDPEIVLCPTSHDRPVELNSVLQRPRWQTIQAIRDRRVYLVNGDHISRCGPRLLEALDQIVSLLHSTEEERP
ncbi:ABC transporter substrate-binding protein [Pirellulaceae bacterium SH449]